MAGLSKAYGHADIPQGPADMWINVELPADTSGTTMLLDATALTPDATASASGIHLGKVTVDGYKTSWKPSWEAQMSDETSAPYRYALGQEEATISGTFLESLKATVLAKMMPGSTQVAPTGKIVQDFGGLTTFSTYTCALIWKMSEAPTMAVVFQLFKTFNEAGLELNIVRGKDAGSPFVMRGQAISTRSAGRQIGQLWKMIP